MKKIIYSFAVAALLFGSMLSASAQNTLETTVGTDIVSQYIWRGQDLGDVSLQPTLGISYKGLSLSAWGSVGLSNPTDTKEFDLTLGYTVGGLNIGVTDYWFNAGLDPLNRYFTYASDCTNHLFEFTIGYDLGFASLQWYTNFAGNDGVDKRGERAYSSYLEANVPIAMGGLDWTATAGVVPFATDFYGVNGFSVVNLALTATKDIRVTETFSIPVFAQIAANPCSQNAYLVLGITLQP
ncbi:MAG: hypothetical protein J6Z20_05795 [Bacteroidales bacterium]|nr:hypothetical protein [Bacteroidales bacterium]MBP5740630.1 hypothetical protein [Bacteroidales bacterium]MCR5243862.1 hypothetical protein [Bacteroidales bacterium]